MRTPRFDGTAQLIRRAGFGQEAEDLTFIHRRDCGVAPRLSRQQNARGLRIQLPDVLEQRRPSIPGMRMSETMTAGAPLSLRICRALFPPLAASTW